MKNNFNYHRQTVAALSGSRWTKSLVGCLTGLLLLASFSSANAAPQISTSYTGPNGGQWGTNTNWMPSTVPNSTSANATVNSDSTASINIGANNSYTVRDLSISGTGAFNLNGGTLIIGGIESIIDAESSVTTISSTLQISNNPEFRSVNQLTAGVITGTGSLALFGNGKGSTGTFTLSAANSYTGDTYLFGGKLILGNSQSLSSGTLFITFIDPTIAYANGINIANNIKQGQPLVLEVDNSDTATQSGIISDFTGTPMFTPQPVTKIGTGTLILSGANTYTGGTTINAGTLEAGNASAFGTGAVTLNGGTLKTNNINHVINVGGNFVQTGGTLSLNINGAPGAASNDVVNVHGTAALGGNLAINYTPGTVPPNKTTTYTVITTTGGVTNAGIGYTTPTLFAGALRLSISGLTVGNNFEVTLTSLQSQFIPLNNQGANYTSNQRAVAAYFDQFDTTLASGPTLLLLQALDGVSINPAELGSAFDQLVPTRFENFTNSTAVNNFSFWVQQLDEYIANHRDSNGNFVASNGGIDTTGFAVNNPEIDGSLQSISSRLVAWNPAPMPGLLSDMGDPVLGGVTLKDPKSMTSQQISDPWDVFINGNVVLAQDFSDPSAGIAGANSTTGAVQIGADYRFSQNFLLGLTFAYGQTYATLDTIGSNATVNTYSPGIYASYSDGGWYANGLGSYGFTNYNQNRHVAIGAFNGTANSNPAGDQFLANFDGGYNFHKGNWTYGPTAGLQYMHISVDGYSETGLPGADLTVGQNDGNSLRSLLGGRVAYEFKGAGMTFEPYFNASWQHEYLNQARGITTQFNGIGAGSFVINTPNPSQNSAVAQLGMNAQINNALMTFVDYTIQAGQSNYFGQSVQAGFKIGF